MSGLSIRWKLFLFLGGLLTVVTVAFGAATYRAMRKSALADVSVRLDGLAAQWVRLFESGQARQAAALRAVANGPAVRGVLAGRTPAAAAAAMDGLRPLLPPGQSSAVQLLDQARTLVVSVGDTAVAVTAPVGAGLLDSAARSDSMIVGPLRAAGRAVVVSFASRVMGGGAVAGYLTQTTQLQVNPSPDQLNQLFGGGSTKVRLANLDGSVWTDLDQPVPPPAARPALSPDLLSYEAPAGGKVFAAARVIRGTPWVVVIEITQREVLGPSHRLLLQLLAGGAIAVGLGMVAVILMSGSLTRPVARLTESVEAVASGDAPGRGVTPASGDELRRLGRAFDEMVGRVEESLTARRDAEAYYRSLFESIPLPTWLFDRETLAILAVNDAAIRHYGYRREEFLTMTVADLRPPEDVARFREEIRESAGREYQRRGWRHRKKDGTLIDVEVHARSMMFQGRDARLVVVHDLTERKQALHQVQLSDERYRRLIEESSDGITLSTLSGVFLAVNPAFVRMMGYDSEAELMGLNPLVLYADPDERGRIWAKLAETGQIRREEIQLRRRDGKGVTVQMTARLVSEAEGTEQYLEAVLADVTELRRVERQFHQAQKMEAVGQLAGGVAHDFNNMLTIILSYSDMLLAEPKLTGSDREAVEAIRGAGASAAALTRQLLVFSRQEVIQPQVMRVNELISGTGKMLKRLIGEHVVLAMALAPDAGAVKVDPGQLEQVIVNLAVNARDAMPEGGRLTIESGNLAIQAEGSYSENLPPGAYVTLVVSDNGIGMDAATQARIFEPFFTTKVHGKGTGLGLATVYGIVTQSGGHIAVYSEPGRGTSFRIYLPRADESLVTAVHSPDSSEAPEGTETILLVEDENTLRGLVVRILERKGYTVLAAANGPDALALLEQRAGTIQLLLTDVVMPEMSGRELADRVKTLRPDIRVLFMSGYTDDAIVHHGVLEAGMQFIGKPFAIAALVRKVREVLDAPVT